MVKSSKCLEKILMQWGSLETYFLSNFDLVDGATESDTDEKPSREKRLINSFKEPVSELFAMFVQFAIPVSSSFNIFLQAKEPLIHILHHSTLGLYPSSISRFILLEVISESDDVLNIELKNHDVFRDFNSIFIGAMTKQYAKDSNTMELLSTKNSSKKLGIFSLNVQSTCKHQCQC